MADFPLSSAQLAQITQAIKDIEFNVERLAAKIVDKTTKVGRAVKDSAEESANVARKQIDRIDEAYEYFENENIFRFDRLAKSINTTLGDAWIEHEKQLDRTQKKYEEFGKEVHRQMTQARGGLGAAGSALGVQGLVGASGGMMNQILSQLPFGGLIGLALFGAMKPAEFAARAHTAGRAFEQVGEMGRGVVRQLTDMAESMFEEWGMAPGAGGAELSALTGAFAKFGVSGTEAMQTLNIDSGRFGSSILAVSFAMDNLTKSATGTFGEAISTAVQNSGQDIKDVAGEVIALGLNLRNTGANVGQFISTLMQATSGLRLQRQGVGDLAKSYALLQVGLSSGVLAGADPKAIAARTLSGVSAIAGGISQMPEGLSAILGERISARSGRAVTGTDALMEMKRGGVGQGGAFMGEVVRELGTMMQEITRGGSRNDLVFALEKFVPSLGFEGSEAVIAINEAMKADMAEGLTWDQTVAKHQDALNKAFMSRDKEQSEFEKVMQKATLALVDIGVGLLSFMGIVAMSLRPDTLKGLFKTLTRQTPTLAETKAMGEAARASNVFWNTGIKQIAKGALALGDIGVDLAKMLVPAADAPQPEPVPESQTTEKVFDTIRGGARRGKKAFEKAAKKTFDALTTIPEGARSMVVPIDQGVDSIRVSLIRMPAGSPSILVPV